MISTLEHKHEKKENRQVHKSFPREGLILYLQRHLQACLHSIGQMSRAPLTTILISLVIAIALAIPSGLYVLLHNLQQFTAKLGDSSQISLYLKKETSSVAAEQLVKKLKDDPTIQQANFISPEQGLNELRQVPEFGEALSLIDKNPLPAVIVISPKLDNQTTDKSITTLIDELKALPQVQNVQMDMMWVKRLNAIIDVSKRLIYTLTCLLGIGVFLIIGNTIYLATQRHRKEIEVYKLVGANNAFVRRPFLYSGALYGLAGGLLAWLITFIGIHSLDKPLQTLWALYNSHYLIQGLTLSSSLFLIIGAICLGLLGSWIAVERYLYQTR